MGAIVVTGAAGYLGSWVVAEALRMGHAVHGTVRDLANHMKIGHLLELGQQYQGRLKLFEADLLREGSFDAAMENAEYIIHTASPYVRAKLEDPQAEIVDPAVEGTRNVLVSATRCESIRRIVVTSSIAAMTGSLQDTYSQPDGQLEESHWNPTSTLQNDPYSYAKTQAERTAWDLSRSQDRWDLVTINPGAIFGPSLSKRSDAESVKIMMQFIQGAFATGVPALHLGVVDVRDVAAAHVQAVLNPDAVGRYLLVNETQSLLRLADIIRDVIPKQQKNLPRRELPKWLIWLVAPAIGMSRYYVKTNVGFPVSFNAMRSVADLGVDYRSISTTLRDHIEQLQRDGLVT